MTGLHQFWQVRIQGMMWKACKFRTVTTIVSVGKDNTKYFGGLYRILPKGFIKISNSKEQQGIRIFGLDGVVLFHQWSHLFCLSLVRHVFYLSIFVEQLRIYGIRHAI